VSASQESTDATHNGSVDPDPASSPSPALDEYLDRVLVVGREHREIREVPYPAWPARVAAERARVADALGPAARRIDHWPDVNHYAEAKGPVVAAITIRTEAWADATGWTRG